MVGWGVVDWKNGGVGDWNDGGNGLGNGGVVDWPEVD